MPESEPFAGPDYLQVLFPVATYTKYCLGNVECGYPGRDVHRCDDARITVVPQQRHKYRIHRSSGERPGELNERRKGTVYDSMQRDSYTEDGAEPYPYCEASSDALESR